MLSFSYNDNISYSYARIKSEKINDIEFAWNELAYTLDFELVPAENEIQTYNYSDTTFYFTNSIAVSVECTPLLENMSHVNSNVYCHLDKAVNESQMIITERPL